MSSPHVGYTYLHNIQQMRRQGDLKLYIHDVQIPHNFRWAWDDDIRLENRGSICSPLNHVHGEIKLGARPSFFALSCSRIVELRLQLGRYRYWQGALRASQPAKREHHITFMIDNARAPICQEKKGFLESLDLRLGCCMVCSSTYYSALLCLSGIKAQVYRPLPYMHRRCCKRDESKIQYTKSCDLKEDFSIPRARVKQDAKLTKQFGCGFR